MKKLFKSQCSLIEREKQRCDDMNEAYKIWKEKMKNPQYAALYKARLLRIRDKHLKQLEVGKISF